MDCCSRRASSSRLVAAHTPSVTCTVPIQEAGGKGTPCCRARRRRCTWRPASACGTCQTRCQRRKRPVRTRNAAPKTCSGVAHVSPGRCPAHALHVCWHVKMLPPHLSVRFCKRCHGRQSVLVAPPAVSNQASQTTRQARERSSPGALCRWRPSASAKTTCHVR
eukprot:1806421-Rhodomonas_salina.1